MKPLKGDSFYIIDRDGKRSELKITNIDEIVFEWDSGVGHLEGDWGTALIDDLQPNPDKSSRVRWILNK